MNEIDILDLIPAESIAEIDRIGYQLLEDCGYDVKGAEDSEEKRQALLQALNDNQDELTYAGQIDSENSKIKVKYLLYRAGKLIKAHSVELIPIQKEKDDEKNRADKEGPAEDT